jgi:hypothetical protein
LNRSGCRLEDDDENPLARFNMVQQICYWSFFLTRGLDEGEEEKLECPELKTFNKHSLTPHCVSSVFVSPDGLRL